MSSTGLVDSRPAAPAHTHDPVRCPAHLPGCPCADRSGAACNPGWDAECPDNLDQYDPQPPEPPRAAPALVVQPLAPPAPPAAAPDPKPAEHAWLVSATIKVDSKTAKHADFRGSFRTAEYQRVDALDVYCGGCRRPYDEVCDQPCTAKSDSEHLVGGDQSVRAKRIIPELPSDAVILRGPSILRTGVSAIIGADGH